MPFDLIIAQCKTLQPQAQMAFYSMFYEQVFQRSYALKINILSNQSHVVLNIPKDQSFEFDYSGRYTDFKDKNVKWNHATFEADNNSLKISGFYGNHHNLGRSVKIKANYGSVALFGR